jgi:GNAT superfamily N-acetyltransferase
VIGGQVRGAKEGGYQIGAILGNHRSMGAPPPTIRLATERDQDAITALLDAAAAWLRTKGTDQWAKPWRTEEDRRERIARDLRAGKTWIMEDGDVAVATFTADRQHDNQEIPVWPERSRDEPAVYVCRLTVHRGYAGAGIGGELLNWIGLTARRSFGARWIRVDVWTTNAGLRSYYQDRGFEFYAESVDPGYPSGALFQKPTEGLKLTEPPLFLVAEPGQHG